MLQYRHISSKTETNFTDQLDLESVCYEFIQRSSLCLLSGWLSDELGPETAFNEDRMDCNDDSQVYM